MSLTKVVAATLALTAATRIAAADPDADVGPKDRNTAIELSLGGVALSGGLVLAGSAGNNEQLVAWGLVSSLVTPSFGEWYAGKFLTVGMGVRALSTVSLFAGVAEAFQCWGSESSCSNNDGLATALIAGGLLGYAGGVIYDVATAGDAADEYNAKHRVHATFAPTVLRPPSGPVVMGVGVGGSF